jgi:hypothetical protein
VCELLICIVTQVHPCSLGGGIGCREGDDWFLTIDMCYARTHFILSFSVFFTLLMLLDLILQHSQSIKPFMARLQLIERVVTLLTHPWTQVVLSAIRFVRTCVALDDEFYTARLEQVCTRHTLSYDCWDGEGTTTTYFLAFSCPLAPAHSRCSMFTPLSHVPLPFPYICRSPLNSITSSNQCWMHFSSTARATTC